MARPVWRRSRTVAALPIDSQKIEPTRDLAVRGLEAIATRGLRVEIGGKLGAIGTERLDLRGKLVLAMISQAAALGRRFQRVERRGQLGDRLVVAVEHDARGRESCVERDCKFAARRDIEVQALLVHELGHGDAEKRLARVRGAVAERVPVRAAADPEIVLVVDVQRRAVLGGQLDEVAATDAEMAVLGDRCRIWQQLEPAQGAVREGTSDQSAGSS